MKKKQKNYANLFKRKVSIRTLGFESERLSQNCLDEIQNEIQDQQALTGDLDAQLREWEKKIRQKQTEIGGANAAITFNANVRKQERVLENRLDTVCGH